MSRTGRTIAQMGLALVLALAAGLLVLRWLSAAPARQPAQAAAPAPTVNVVVAVRDLPRGARLSGDLLKVVPYLSESLPSGRHLDPRGLEGRVLAAAVSANEPVTESRLAPEGSAGGVVGLISEGKRAMAVKGNKVLGLAGFIRPGNTVDILATMGGDASDKPVTKIVLENIPVLATGSEVEPQGKDGKPAPVDVYTLELTPEDGEKLALAATRGVLHFALRNARDNSTVLTPGADHETTLASYRSAPVRPARPAAAKAPERPSVEVIAGSARSQARF